ncbi:MAG: hypothetical protein U0359_12220 [Byssovorax sp.]
MRSALAASFVLVALGCGGTDEGAGGHGGASAATTSTTVTTASAGGGGAGATSGTGGEGGVAQGGRLALPMVIDLPYVSAGEGGSTLEIEVKNTGDLPLMGLAFSLEGSPLLSFAGAPASLAPGESKKLTFTFAGAAQESIAEGMLKVTGPSIAASVPVFGVAGDPAIGQGAWEVIEGQGGVIAGEGLTVDLPAAPFPDGNAPFDDASVQVFLPEGYRDRGAQDMVVHFHGHNTTLASTLAAHRYRQHLYASGSNAVLVVPQGPVNTASGDFGKLMKPGGLARLLTEVNALLYREGKIAAPVLGEVALTSHSGGYQAVALNIAPPNDMPEVRQVDLFDSLYGYESTYETFAVSGAIYRSNYTAFGGTKDNNQAMVAWLKSHGEPPFEDASQRHFADAKPVVYFADTSHDGSTRIDGAYGEELRWSLPHARRGPRIELRAVVENGGTATVRWLAPADEDVSGFVVETSKDGQVFAPAAKVAADQDHASFALPGGGVRVRVRSVIDGMPDTLSSDVYRVDAKPKILVVDGFDRILDGSFGGLFHDFAARVAESAGPVATISNEAVTEDGFDLSSWPIVIWLLGDESTGDHTFSPAEQQAVLDYVDGGGALIVSGSEVGYDLDPSPDGAFFLQHCFGASFASDDSGSYTVTGQGPLAGLGPFGYGGAGAPYPENSPDALGVSGGGQVVLEYGNGMNAGVGVPGKAVLVAFPLEVIDQPADRAALLAKLIAFVGG